MVSFGCTTRRYNAHITEQREVYYPWHPWSGRRVFAHEAVDKAGSEVFRCSLSGLASDRWLEIPVWMFDRAASASWRLMATPLTNMTALGALVALLGDTVRSQDRPSPSQESVPASLSRNLNEGDAHDAQSKVLSVRSVRKSGKRRGGKDAALNTSLAKIAGEGAPDAHVTDDAPDSRSRQPRRRRHSKGGGA